MAAGVRGLDLRPLLVRGNQELASRAERFIKRRQFVASSKAGMDKADRPIAIDGHNQALAVKIRAGENQLFKQTRRESLHSSAERRLAAPDFG